MATYVHTHVGASSPTQIDLSSIGAGFVLAIKISARAGAATVDVDEAGGLARKLVDLGSGTDTTTVNPKVQATDNTGTVIDAQYNFMWIDGPLTVTSSENCTVTVQVVS